MKYFNPNEMRTLLDSKFYSILYYNAVIWLTPELNNSLKQSLLSISANALRSCVMFYSNEISFENIHKQCEKSTPKQISLYHISLNLHKLLNFDPENITFEHLTVLEQLVCTGRQLNYQTFRTNRTKIGMNTTANKLYHLNNQVRLDQLNLTFVHLKKLAKIQFLKYGKT